jgi:hypothetical protein
MTFRYEQIHLGMSWKQASDQWETFMRLGLDENGMPCEEGLLDQCRVEAAWEGRRITRAQARAELQRKQAEHADETPEQSLQRFIALIQPHPERLRQVTYATRLVKRAYPGTRDTMAERSRALKRLRIKMKQLGWPGDPNWIINQVATELQRWNWLPC